MRDKFDYILFPFANANGGQYNIGGHGYGSLPKVIKPRGSSGGGKTCAVWCSSGVLDTYCCQYENK